MAEEVPGLGLCEMCGNGDEGEQIAEICELLELPYWPPAGWTARQVIEDVRSLVGMTKSNTFACHGTGTVTWEEVSGLASDVEHQGKGLCLRCLREDNIELQHCTDTAHKY